MRILIIGNGIAANSAASVIRRSAKDARITLIAQEKDPLYSACSLPYYVAGRLTRRGVYLRTKRSYKDEDINVLFGQKATTIDTLGKKLLLEDNVVPYDRLILAVGSQPETLPDSSGRDGIFTLKTVLDADRILAYPGRRAVVIGAGPVAIEAATALRERGYEVTMIVRSRIMRRLFDERSSEILRGILEKNGVSIHTAGQITGISGEGRVRAVLTDSGAVDCDLVIMAAGMKPNVSLAKDAGMKIGALGGITTDAHMRTSATDVFACGDCVESADLFDGKPVLNLTWHNAKEQGYVAGFNAIGIEKTYPGSQSLTGLDLFGTHAVSIGRTTDAVKGEVEVIEKDRGGDYFRILLVNGVPVGAQIIGKTRYAGVWLALMRKGANLHDVIESSNISLAPMNIIAARLKTPDLVAGRSRG